MDIEKIIAEMTLEEKCSLLSGADFWHTKTVERLGIGPVMVSDGPHGLRTQNSEASEENPNTSIEAVCMPPACAAAASFDRDLIYREGEVIGNEARCEKLGVVLGPAMNIKRSPLCGRNFEYYSEDPYLAGEIASSLVKGIQSRGVGACGKHFAANNQEYRRFTINSVVDERTMREIYLPAFETSVKKGGVLTMMCGYNRLNGEHCAANKHLLTEILRDEWGFKGYVMSDWGAVDDRVEDVRAGLDLQMPGSFGEDDRLVVEAVRNGELDESYVDACVRNLLSVHAIVDHPEETRAAWDKQADHDFSGAMAEQCMVLLKNEDGILPLAKGEKIAVLGEFAEKPRFQGGGSSHVNSFKVTAPLDTMRAVCDAVYAPGYRIKSEVIDEAMLGEAEAAAKQADKVVVFAGMPDSYESEGYDRKHLRIPANQVELIRRAARVNPNVVVVLNNGSPIEMPWIDDVKGILEAYLTGEDTGTAVARILFGDVCPSGRLPETFPLRIEDTSPYPYYGSPEDDSVYGEGVFVGYRWYNARGLDVLFPFGYGLSYTRFAYSNLRLSAAKISDADTLTVSVDVTNTGDRAGKEVVQLYVSDTHSSIPRPVRELKGFEKVSLEPGETKTVSIELEKRAFAYWNTRTNDWFVESGDFGIEICSDARTVILRETVYVESADRGDKIVTLDTPYEDIRAFKRITPKMQALLDLMRKVFVDDDEADAVADEAITGDMKENQLAYTPLRMLITLGSNTVTYREINAAIDEMNEIYH